MRSYADTLNTRNYTVKALREIAKRMGLKRYSALRKADLAILIAESIEMPAPILDVEAPADHAEISAILAAVVSEAQSTPVKAPESAAETVSEEAEEENTLEDLLTAYSLMKRTWNKARGDQAKRLLVKLINLRNEVKAMGYNPVKVGMGYSVA